MSASQHAQCVNRGLVPVGPWKAYLEDLHRWHSPQEVATLLGSLERRVWRWRFECDWVSLGCVDRALVNAGSPGLLNELYPACDACGHCAGEHADGCGDAPLELAVAA